MPSERSRHPSNRDTTTAGDPHTIYYNQVLNLVDKLSPHVTDAERGNYEHFVRLGKECMDYRTPDVSTYGKYTNFGLSNMLP